MEISTKDFLENFSAQFETTDKSLITFATDFKNLDEWDSMTALSLIAMADESYNARLTGDDIRNSTLVEDLYNIIKAKAS